MLRALLENRIVSAVLMTGMVLLTAVCIFKMPDVILLKRISMYSTHIMILLLGAGVFFHMISQKRLLFTAFGCVAALCLHFKQVANINLVVPIKTTEPTLSIMQTSTSYLVENWEGALGVLKESDADMVSILEMTPDWEALLNTRLTREYPYRIFDTRIDIFGTAFFSKHPFLQSDTLYFEEIPHLEVSVDVGQNHVIHVYCFSTNPPLFRNSLLQLRNQLDGIADIVDNQDVPCIVTGNFNLDQFADEIQDFRAKSELLDSRKTMSPSLVTPTNHIFYSKDFECLRFANVYDTTSLRIGIIGEYQFKSRTDIAN